jgi:hypothetical protein
MAEILKQHVAELGSSIIEQRLAWRTAATRA